MGRCINCITLMQQEKMTAGLAEGTLPKSARVRYKENRVGWDILGNNFLQPESKRVICSSVFADMMDCDRERPGGEKGV